MEATVYSLHPIPNSVRYTLHTLNSDRIVLDTEEHYSRKDPKQGCNPRSATD